MKLAFGLIMFNSDFVLRECIQSLLDANVGKVYVVEGPVQYYSDKGFTTSTDDTNDILRTFGNSITVHHGQFAEKREMQDALLEMMPNDIDYFFQVDADEVYKSDDLKRIVEFLKENRPSKVAIPSKTFCGLKHLITGMEEGENIYWRIFKVSEGCQFSSHRPPTIMPPQPGTPTSSLVFERLGIYMYHYSYVSPRCVLEKTEYYAEVVNPYNITDKWFAKVWLPWMTGNDKERAFIETQYDGVHEFKNRPTAYTKPFTGSHPARVRDSLPRLEKTVKKELEYFTL
jgi:hypothetical protein